MEELIQKINDLFNKGHETKDIARKSDDNLELYKTAATFYSDAAKTLETVIQQIDSSKINFLTRSKALKEYYLFEFLECSYAYEYKNFRFDEATRLAREGKLHIDTAIKIIDDNFANLNEEAKTFLAEMKSNWTLCQLTIPIRIIEPSAKSAINKKDFVTAMDNYREMNRLQDAVFNYVNNSQTLKEVYKRIENGNYYSSKASIANSIAGIYLQNKKGDFQKDILEQFLIALENIKKAQDINPEWNKFKEGADTTIKNIKLILQDTKSDWDKFYFNFENNQQLKAIMKETNVKKFNELELKRKLDKTENKGKKLLLYGGFWLSAFLIIFASVVSLFLLKINWTIIILIVLLVQLLYAMIAATVLRNLGDLSEKGLLEIYKLTLKLNFNLFNKNKPKV